MFNKIKERKFHLLVLAFLIGLFLGMNFSFVVSAEEPAHKYLDYFHQVYQIIRSDYVDTPQTKNIFYGAINGMIQALNDPFSRFLDEEAFAELKEETTGEFVGIGIEITVKEGEVVVISPIEDTPAMKAGIRAGDIITRVDGKAIKNKELNEIIKMIRGVPHSKVKITVKREGFDEPMDLDVERVAIKIDTVNYDIIKDTKIGYLKVKVFSSDTGRDIEKAIKFFNGKGVNKMVVDLRWNPGGLLDMAIRISDFFLDKDKVIVSTRGREGSGNVKEFRSTNGPLYKGELVVLVNKGSASASEIFSGAIKDNKRGRLVGEKTFGKGSVQKFFNLSENTGVTLTIARYFTPSGVSIHGKGIVPDVVVPLEDISEKDKKKISILYKEKLMDQFLKTHREYTEGARSEFNNFLKEKNIIISARSANFILKNEIFRYSKRPLYDLEFDNQLGKALGLLGGQ